MSFKQVAFDKKNDYFGGAVLADSECGSVTLRMASGAIFSFNLDHDPEFTLSGLENDYSEFDGYVGDDYGNLC